MNRNKLINKNSTYKDEIKYQGFSLRDVTWGYRDIFKDVIEQLFEEGYLGSERKQVTYKFFELLKQTDKSCFDNVINEFLIALNPDNRWIMNLPGIFTDVVDTGKELSQIKLNYGIRFYKTLAKQGLGKTPEQIRYGINWIQRLRIIDVKLAVAFMDGCRKLFNRMNNLEIEKYIDVALNIYQINNDNAYKFLRCELATCETYILSITQECRLSDVSEHLKMLIKALTGNDFEVNNLGMLDSDELIGRRTSCLTVNGHIYLPNRFRGFDNANLNRSWYILSGISSAAAICENSFARIHGYKKYRTCSNLVGREPWKVNLFQILETVRILNGACLQWPGVRKLIKWGLDNDLKNRNIKNDPADIIAIAMNGKYKNNAIDSLLRTADESVNCFDTAEKLDYLWYNYLRAEYPQIDQSSFVPLSFFSDFMFPVDFSAVSDNIVNNLKRKTDRKGKFTVKKTKSDSEEKTAGKTIDDKTEKSKQETLYIYDEWDYKQNHYLPQWCNLYQKKLEQRRNNKIYNEWRQEAHKVKTLFERLKPVIARREKHLSDGDNINTDILLSHIVDMSRSPDPPVRFYEKAVVNHRDIAVLILLDISGSTSSEIDLNHTVLDVEKKAAVVLGHGLNELDDSFAVCAFSSHGKENCEYFVFKDFDDRWNQETVDKVMSAYPRSSTRIGPALRHSGELLANRPAKQRLIILVTDGKPMDNGYDSSTSYAQHDIRMACQENLKRDIHTFAISTEENSLADMEIMFPQKKFVILPAMDQLPRILPQLYLRMTL